MQIAMEVGRTSRPERVKVLLARLTRATEVLLLREFLTGLSELTKPVMMKKIATAPRPPTTSLKKGSWKSRGPAPSLGAGLCR